MIMATTEDTDPFSPVIVVRPGFIEATGGILVPINRARVSAKEVVAAIQDALTTDYDGEDPRLAGLSKNEAAVMALAREAQDGSLEAIRYLHDRMMGKPIQSTFSLNATADLKDFLSELAGKEKASGSSIHQTDEDVPRDAEVFDV